MKKIDDKLWKQIDPRGEFPKGFRDALDEIVQAYDRPRADTTVRSRPWKATLSKIEKLQKLSADLKREVDFMDFDVYRALFHGNRDDDGIGVIKNKLSDVSDDLSSLLNISEAAIMGHKKENLYTQNRLKREFLDILVREIDDAHYFHTDNYIRIKNRPAVKWIVDLVRFIDEDAAEKPDAVIRALQRLIKERNAPVDHWEDGLAGNQHTLDLEVNAVFQLGKRYLVVSEVHDDAVTCEIQEDLSGVGMGRVEEIMFDDLPLLDRLDVSPVERDYPTPPQPLPPLWKMNTIFVGRIPNVSRDYRVIEDGEFLRIYRAFDGDSGWYPEATVCASVEDWKAVLEAHVMRGGEGLNYVVS